MDVFPIFKYIFTYLTRHDCEVKYDIKRCWYFLERVTSFRSIAQSRDTIGNTVMAAAMLIHIAEVGLFSPFISI